MRLTGTILVTGLLISGSMLAQEPPLVGPEFQVNTYTNDRQDYPSVAALPQGGFVVVWQSKGAWEGLDTSYTSIQGQRFDNSGMPLGGQFQVNSNTFGYQTSPKIAMNGQERFMVVWQHDGDPVPDSTGIQAQLFDASGTRIGGEIPVNSYTTGGQYRPAVAADRQGNFVVTWNTYSSPGDSYYSIQAQRFDNSGTQIGGEFQVNSYTTNEQWIPGVAAAPGGRFMVIWTSNGSWETDTDADSMQAQFYNSDGTTSGSQFQVNTYTTNSPYTSDVAADPNGNFVVAWSSNGSSGTDTFYSSVLAQRYDANSTPVGSEFQVNSYTTSDQWFPSVATGPDGEFVVLWQSYGSYGSDTDDNSIQAQRYDSNATAVGSQFQVNSYSSSSQIRPSVAADSYGNLVAVWQSNGSNDSDSDSFSILAQRLLSARIFLDGFESGDTSAWSNSVP